MKNVNIAHEITDVVGRECKHRKLETKLVKTKCYNNAPPFKFAVFHSSSPLK